MSKKSKRTKQSGRARQSSPTQQHQPSQMHEQVVQRILHASEQIHAGDFAGCIRTCEALRIALPRRSEMYLETLALLGLAHGMLNHYHESYAVFSEAIAISPTVAEYWYNRGLACTYLSHPAEAVQNFERAVALAKNATGAMTRKFALQLEDSRRELQEAMRAHEAGITFEQYLERETCFVQAMALIKQEKWHEAELLFRELTETGSRVSSYWGNLGVCLMMQSQYDEAEEALKQALVIDPGYAIARDNLRALPDIRRAKGPAGLTFFNTSRNDDARQVVALYDKDETGEIIASSIIEKVGDKVSSTTAPIGKQPPRYDFFLNKFQDTRFTTCPHCKIKTRPRKFSLVVYVNPNYTIVIEKICRFCYVCDLLIVHQDQLEQKLADEFTTINPEAIGNNYRVAGTVDKKEWDQGQQDPFSSERMTEYQHDFREVVTFQRVPI